MANLFQVLENRIVRVPSGWSVSFISVPSEALGEEIKELPQDLFEEILVPVVTGDVLPYVLWGVVSQDSAATARTLLAEHGEASIPSDDEGFFHTLAYVPFVPMGTSQLRKESLAAILAPQMDITERYGLNVFAAAVAYRGRPFVLVASPGGIVLVGAATNVRVAFELGLWDKIMRRLGVAAEGK